MKISRAVREMDLKGRQGWHTLTVAESGFSALIPYVESDFGLDPVIGAELADRINQQDEPGSLYPKAPISAIPCRYFREQADSEDPAVMEDFKRHISEFIEVNQTHIKAPRILVNFGVCHDPVPLRYIEATEEVFRNSPNTRGIKEVVIFL